MKPGGGGGIPARGGGKHQGRSTLVPQQTYLVHREGLARTVEEVPVAVAVDLRTAAAEVRRKTAAAAVGAAAFPARVPFPVEAYFLAALDGLIQ